MARLQVCKRGINSEDCAQQSAFKRKQKLDENVIDISDGKLRVNKTKSKSGLNKNYLQESLAELTQDPTKATSMTKHILENRPTTERINLKRTFNRQNKN